MNKENKEEMLSFDGDIYFERMFSPICFGCKHHHFGEGRCDAFPERDSIPPEIWLGKRSHLIPYPGDQGILYEPNPKCSPQVTQQEIDLQLRLQEEGNSDG